MSMIHDTLIVGSDGLFKSSTIHNTLIVGSDGLLKSSTIHEGVTLHRGGGATK